MYAIIDILGKQFKVKEGDYILAPRMEKNNGDDVEIDKVLLFQNEDDIKVGQPYVEGVSVKGKFLQEVKDKKVISFKYKPKKNYSRKKGHRQKLSKIKIEKIEA